MTKQIKIEELIPFMNEGWVACDKDGVWCWYSAKPKLKIWNGYWDCSGKYFEEIPYMFSVAPAEDWTKSLIKVGGNKNDR